MLPSAHVSPSPAASCISAEPCSGQLLLASLILNSKFPSSSSSLLNFCKYGSFTLITQLGYLLCVNSVYFLRNLFWVFVIVGAPSISEKKMGAGSDSRTYFGSLLLVKMMKEKIVFLPLKLHLACCCCFCFCFCLFSPGFALLLYSSPFLIIAWFVIRKEGSSETPNGVFFSRLKRRPRIKKTVLRCNAYIPYWEKSPLGGFIGCWGLLVFENPLYQNSPPLPSR